MGFVIDLSTIPTDNPFVLGVWFFTTIGWIFPVFLFVYGLILGWQLYIRNEYRKQRKYIVLSISIPKDHEQTPKAVENIFNHLSGAHQPLKFYHQWWSGEIKDSFSFEIVSHEGYISFVLHFRDIYRDFIEAIIYAQYPDAEINEVDDYTPKYNVKFPHDKYDLVGSEIILTNKEIYPIITYKEFEDSVSGEIKDPLASLLEAMTRIGPGEEIWVQYLVTPADNDWGKKAEPVVAKLSGAPVKTKKSWIDYIFDIPNIIFEALGPATTTENKPNKSDMPTQYANLTGGQKSEIDAIENKTGKIGFHVRIRFIYLAEKDKFHKPKAVSGIYGGLKQFNSLGLNGLKMDSKSFTGGIVWFKKRRLIIRKNKILYRYRHRGDYLLPGEYGFILNGEELASLWHFPGKEVKAPLLQRTEAKRSEPPSGLPTEYGHRPTSVPTSQTAEKAAEPPANLPV